MEREVEAGKKGLLADPELRTFLYKEGLSFSAVNHAGQASGYHRVTSILNATQRFIRGKTRPAPKY